MQAKASGMTGTISIHAPRGGSDIQQATVDALAIAISIHAPRGGSDITGGQLIFGRWYFNPRSPRGERPLLMR